MSITNNKQIESFYDAKNRKTTINLYKTIPGDYYVIDCISDISISDYAILSDPTVSMSPGLKEFFKECLRKPLHCDMSNNGFGINYIFCETLKTLAICTANLSVDDNNYSMNYRIYVLPSEEMPEELPNLTGKLSYEFTVDGQLDTPSQNVNGSLTVGVIGEFTSYDFLVKKSSNGRTTNKYNICTNKTIICDVKIELDLVPDSGLWAGRINPLGTTSFTFSFPINKNSFIWDNGGNLTVVNTQYEQNIQNGHNAIISVAMDENNSAVLASLIIAGSNFGGTPPTQTVISAVFTENIPILPLTNFGGSASSLGGWAAYNIFSGAKFSVEFSDAFPGQINYSPDPLRNII